MVLVGRPTEPSYVSALKSLEASMEMARQRLFPKGCKEHRRGLYPNVSTGISYGGGSKVGRRPISMRTLLTPQMAASR